MNSVKKTRKLCRKRRSKKKQKAKDFTTFRAELCFMGLHRGVLKYNKIKN